MPRDNEIKRMFSETSLETFHYVNKYLIYTCKKIVTYCMQLENVKKEI